MLLTIVQNGSLHITDNCIDRLLRAASDVTQGSVFRELRIGGGDMQGLVEAQLRHMVDASNIRDSHPETHRADITGHEVLMILLKLLIRLDRVRGGKEQADQRHP